MQEEYFIVYAVKSVRRNYIYVGLTRNLSQRLHFHNHGLNRTTRPYRPFKVIYTESFKTRILARQREKELKNGEGKEFLKTLF